MMSDESSGNNDDRGMIHNLNEMGIQESLQSARLFYHFQSTTGSSLTMERPVVPQLGLNEAQSEIERLTIENQKLKDIIISMHLNSPAPLNYRNYHGHGPSSSRILERIEGTESVVSNSSSLSQAPNALNDGSFTDNSLSIASFSSGRSAPACSRSEGTIGSRVSEIPPEILASDESNSEDDFAFDTCSESSSDCSTIRIIEVDDTSSNIESESETIEATISTAHVKAQLDVGRNARITETSKPELDATCYNQLGYSNDSPNTQTAVAVDEEHGASDFLINLRDNERSNGCLDFSVPEDFDPEQDDILSDVETVLSDEALAAWGIEGGTTSDKIQPKLKKVAQHGAACSDEENGWEEVFGQIDFTPNLRLCNFQILPGPPATLDDSHQTIIGIKADSNGSGEDDASAIRRDNSTLIASETVALARPELKVCTDQLLIDRLEWTGVDENDKKPLHENQPQPPTAISEVQKSEQAMISTRGKGLKIASVSGMGAGYSIYSQSNIMTNSLTPKIFDTYNNMIPLVPVVLSKPVEYIIQSQECTEWMNPKPTPVGDSIPIQAQGENATPGIADIIKGEHVSVNKPKNDSASKQSPEVIQRQLEAPEKQLEDNSLRKAGDIVDNSLSTGPKTGSVIRPHKLMAQGVRIPATKNLSPTPAAVNTLNTRGNMPIKVTQITPSRVTKANNKSSSQSPPKDKGSGTTPLSPQGHSEDTELPHKRSIRFNDSSTPGTAKIEPLLTKIDTNKPLVSILKPTSTGNPPMSLSDKTRIYNYEYIREVVIKELPRNITLSGLLSQITGGLLEKVLINSQELSARVVFVEPEAARKFYNNVQRTGFSVPRDFTGAEPSFKERMFRCKLTGFTWSDHSCEIPMHIAQQIWRLNATRCIMIDNFPKDVGVMKFVVDVLKLLNLPEADKKVVIERTSMERNSARTKVLLRVGFSCIQYAIKVCRQLSTYSQIYSKVIISFDKDPCGGLVSGVPPSSWADGKTIDNGKQVVPSPIVPQVSAKKMPTSPPKSTMETRADIVAAWGRFGAEGQAASTARAQVKSHVISSSLPVVADVSVSFKGFPPMNKTQKLPEEPHTNSKAPTKPTIQKASIEGNKNTSYSPAVLGKTLYSNWDVGFSIKTSPPPTGADWGHGDEKAARQYQAAIEKRARKMSEDTKFSEEKLKVANLRPDSPLNGRVVHLKNLPRNFHVARLFRFIRGGMVEHVELRAPNSEYNTSSAIVVFVDQASVKNYKAYLKSPGLTVEKDHRIVFAETIAPDTVANIRSLSHNNFRTRCLHIESLPQDTMLGEFLGIIEENMNHSNLEFEHATVCETKNSAEAFLRLLSIGTAVFVAQVLERNYTGITITFIRDPCDGPVEELNEVNLEL